MRARLVGCHKDECDGLQHCHGQIGKSKSPPGGHHIADTGGQPSEEAKEGPNGGSYNRKGPCGTPYAIKAASGIAQTLFAESDAAQS